MTTGDPIVQEVRRTREGLARKSGNNLHRIFSTLRDRESKDDRKHPLVTHAEPGQSGGPRTAVVRDGE
jgi:hypothetical protein